jgi:aminoglycoside 6'-N-acetyltransferase I
MKFTVRQMGAPDRAAWAEMRATLWPEEPLQAHAEWIDEILGREDTWGFIAETIDGAPAGFAEVAIRKYANGCETRPVPFLEGIWVKAEFRRQGIGNALIAHAGALLAALGFREIGSDSEIDNHAAHASHLSWGFSETERVVYFRKSLKASAR